jgi:hypothetical protein
MPPWPVTSQVADMQPTCFSADNPDFPSSDLPQFFVLFVCYSAILAGVGAAHSLYDFTYEAPARLGLQSLYAAGREHHARGLSDAPEAVNALLHACLQWLWQLCERAQDQGCAAHTVALALTCILNPVAAVALLCGALLQLLLVLANRTMLMPRDRTYDVGLRENWLMVRSQPASRHASTALA